MSFGKVYGYIGNPRTAVVLMLAKYFDLDVELVEMGGGKFTPEYEANFPWKKIPAFIGADGVVLHQVTAIAFYFAQQKPSTLLGTTPAEKASIIQWASFINMDAAPALSSWWMPLVGRQPYNKKAVEKAEQDFVAYAGAIEAHLAANTFLVSERLTIADIISAAILTRGFQYVFGAQWRASYPAITRWYTLITNQPFWDTIPAAPAVFIEEAVKYTPPKKEEKPKKEAAKKEAAPKPAAEEDDTTEEVKVKHPLEALGPAKSIPIDAWKRQYSNEDTRPVALPWFWEHYDPSEYSLWRVNYKYNDELTLTFMSANLIGGFFNRLQASTKFLFGCLVVYGVSNDSGITGAFLVRGQDALPAFKVAPDWESYEFVKLDASKTEDKEFVEDMWAWDKPVVVDGVSKEIADGKVFK